MHQHISRLALLLGLLGLAVSCAAAPPPEPPAQDLAWLWLPAADRSAEPSWRFGEARGITSGDLVAVTAAGRQRLLGRGVSDIIERPGSSPLATLPLAPTGQLALVDPATGTVVSDRAIARGGVIAPDGARFAARVNIDDPNNGLFNTLQITRITSGITSTTDLFDNYSLRYQNVLSAWGPHYIYGQTYENLWIHSLWWIDPDSPGSARQSFAYGVDTFADTLAFDAQTDTLVYTWQPDVSSAVVTTTLMLRNTFTGEARQIGAGEPWPQAQGVQFSDLALSPDGRYLACLQRYADDRPASELRLYDLSQPGPPRILDPALIPWQVLDMGERISGAIYAWSPDSAHLLVRALAQPAGPGASQEALVFRSGDGALVARAGLPAAGGALHLANDLRLMMISYQGEAASLSVYDLRAGAAERRIPLGVQTPIMVYVPGP